MTHQCETEPLTRHKSNNSVYDGTFYWIDNNLLLKCSQKNKMPYYSKCNQDLIFEINHFHSIYQIKWNALTKICGGMCGWAVNTSNSGSGGLGFKPRPSLDKKLYSTFSPLTQVYKWVAATYPIQEGVAIFLGMLKAKETGISSGCLDPWPVCTFTLSEAKKSCLLPGAGGSCYQASEFCS